MSDTTAGAAPVEATANIDIDPREAPYLIQRLISERDDMASRVSVMVAREQFFSVFIGQLVAKHRGLVDFITGNNLTAPAEMVDIRYQPPSQEVLQAAGQIDPLQQSAVAAAPEAVQAQATTEAETNAPALENYAAVTGDQTQAVATEATADNTAAQPAAEENAAAAPEANVDAAGNVAVDNTAAQPAAEPVAQPAEQPAAAPEANTENQPAPAEAPAPEPAPVEAPAPEQPAAAPEGEAAQAVTVDNSVAPENVQTGEPAPVDNTAPAPTPTEETPAPAPTPTEETPAPAPTPVENTEPVNSPEALPEPVADAPPAANPEPVAAADNTATLNETPPENVEPGSPAPLTAVNNTQPAPTDAPNENPAPELATANTADPAVADNQASAPAAENAPAASDNTAPAAETTAQPASSDEASNEGNALGVNSNMGTSEPAVNDSVNGADNSEPAPEAVTEAVQQLAPESHPEIAPDSVAPQQVHNEALLPTAVAAENAPTHNPDYLADSTAQSLESAPSNDPNGDNNSLTAPAAPAVEDAYVLDVHPAANAAETSSSVPAGSPYRAMTPEELAEATQIVESVNGADASGPVTGSLPADDNTGGAEGVAPPAEQPTEQQTGAALPLGVSSHNSSFFGGLSADEQQRVLGEIEQSVQQIVSANPSVDPGPIRASVTEAVVDSLRIASGG